MFYDEEAEITRYVWRNHWNLLTRFERQVEQAAHARANFADAKGDHASRIKDRFGRLGDPEINAALAEGHEAFHRAACRRILAENANLKINRCSRCHRILRTALALQCFWCGFDWHHGTAFLEGDRE